MTGTLLFGLTVMLRGLLYADGSCLYAAGCRPSPVGGSGAPFRSQGRLIFDADAAFSHAAGILPFHQSVTFLLLEGSRLRRRFFWGRKFSGDSLTRILFDGSPLRRWRSKVAHFSITVAGGVFFEKV